MSSLLNVVNGKKIIVKIGDFGLARELYFNDYYMLNGSKPLPVRCKFDNKKMLHLFL